MELTLEELARIALGVPEMNHVNVAVLHSLLDALMKKLDCQKDLVTIGGFEGKCLERLLERSKISPLPFDVATIVPISSELEKVEAMEKRIASLEAKLDAHFQQIRVCNKVNSKKYQKQIWEQYSSPCEDLCTVCDEDNKIACSLLQNMDFMKKLLRRIASPMMEEMEEIKRNLSEFYEKLKKFLKKTEALFERLELVKQCVIEIENLRELVKNYNLTFLGTMEELQDMLDSKLDKVHMPALKKYIRDHFDDIELRLSKIEEKDSCPRAAGFVNTGIRCISCGNNRIGVDVGPLNIGPLPDATAQHLPHHLQNNCQKALVFRTNDKEPTLMVRVNNLDLNVIQQRLNRPSGKVCKLPDANDTIYGVRNSVYSA
ncbi:uncharacterized protein LOC132794264 [Drosophila nasuta]|uniref:Uncharacterized protein LOC117570972 n=1 Tax=Drosophila albomicans TaxID=7291 RepID=A0A6P8WYG3_DROAB|nr:uncharacterized protein LOC117570972 [Drosophila albomicans]XP_060660559.1 uncharacterized protein LOC132794264 [Drosophila nasuta]